MFFSDSIITNFLLILTVK